MKDKQKLRIIEHALALGAEIHITDEGDKTIIEIKKGEPAPLMVKEWGATPSPTITPTWDTSKWEITTWSSSTCSSSSCERGGE